MIVFADFREPCTNRVRWCMTDGKKITSMESEDIPTHLIDAIRGTTGAVDIYITNMNLYGENILETLWRGGFVQVEGNPQVKKMRANTFKYLISVGVDDSFNYFSITLKRKDRGVRIINADNLIKLQERRDIWESWGRGDFTPQNYARAVFIALSDILTYAGKKARPTTISAIARKQWQAAQGFGDIKASLNNAIGVKLPNGETLEDYCRPAYRGGLCYDNTDGIGDQGRGLVLDANSLYPYIMRNKPLPRGYAHYEAGAPSDIILRDARRGYVYFFVKFRAVFHVKQNKIPSVSLPPRDKQALFHKRGQLENSYYYNRSTRKYYKEFLDTDGKKKPCSVELTLTSTDYFLFLENYEIEQIEYFSYVWQATTTSLFDNFIDFFYEEKKNAKTYGKKRVAKMILNSLSGGMARLPEYVNVIISYDDNGNVNFDTQKTQGETSYIYLGASITAYGREFIIKAAEANLSRWLYSDTDSLHLSGWELPEGITISDRLGDFKIEKKFEHAAYYKKKMYCMILDDGKCTLTAAGVPKASARHVENIIDAIGNEKEILGIVIRDNDDYFFPMSKSQEEQINAIFDGTGYVDGGADIERGADIAETNLINALHAAADPLWELYKCTIPVWYRVNTFFAEELHIKYIRLENELNF